MLHDKRSGTAVVGELLRPQIREAEHLISRLVQLIHQGLGNTGVDLIHIEPELIGSLALLILHRGNEARNDHRVIVDHDHVGADHLQILVDLIEPKSLLLRILIRSGIICYDTLGHLTDVLTLRMALKPEMKGLYLWSQSGCLCQEIRHHLGVSRSLIDVSAHENEAHCVYSLGSV